MKSLSLNGIWKMTGTDIECEGKIPGSLYSFLLDAGMMDDPHYRENEFGALALTHDDYTFSRTFCFMYGWMFLQVTATSFSPFLRSSVTSNS